MASIKQKTQSNVTPQQQRIFSSLIASVLDDGTTKSKSKLAPSSTPQQVVPKPISTKLLKSASATISSKPTTNENINTLNSTPRLLSSSSSSSSTPSTRTRITSSSSTIQPTLNAGSQTSSSHTVTGIIANYMYSIKLTEKKNGKTDTPEVIVEMRHQKTLNKFSFSNQQSSCINKPDEPIRIKCCHDNEIQIFKLELQAPSPYDTLLQQIKEHFQLQLDSKLLRLRYQDADGDMVTVTTHQQLMEAIRFANQTKSHESLFKLHVFDVEEHVNSKRRRSKPRKRASNPFNQPENTQVSMSQSPAFKALSPRNLLSHYGKPDSPKTPNPSEGPTESLYKGRYVLDEWVCHQEHPDYSLRCGFDTNNCNRPVTFKFTTNAALYNRELTVLYHIQQNGITDNRGMAWVALYDYFEDIERNLFCLVFDWIPWEEEKTSRVWNILSKSIRLSSDKLTDVVPNHRSTNKDFFQYLNLCELRSCADKTIKPRKIGMKKVMQDLVGCVSFLHSNGLVFCDLQPDNIVYNPQYNTWTLMNFGNCHQREELLDIASLSCGMSKYYYYPPEMLIELFKSVQAASDMESSHSFRRRKTQKSKYKEVCIPVQDTLDLWNLGLVLYEMCVGYPLECRYPKVLSYFRLSPGQDEFTTNFPPEFYSELYTKVKEPDALNLLWCLLHKSPARRATMQTVTEHAYFQASIESETDDRSRRSTFEYADLMSALSPEK